jgi:hypothetical protein
MRGFGRASVRAIARGNSFEARKPRGQRLRRSVYPARRSVRILVESKALKARLSVRDGLRVRLWLGSAEANVTKGTEAERLRRLCEGKKP